MLRPVLSWHFRVAEDRWHLQVPEDRPGLARTVGLQWNSEQHCAKPHPRSAPPRRHGLAQGPPAEGGRRDEAAGHRGGSRLPFLSEFSFSSYLWTVIQQHTEPSTLPSRESTLYKVRAPASVGSRPSQPEYLGPLDGHSPPTPRKSCCLHVMLMRPLFPPPPRSSSCKRRSRSRRRPTSRPA